MFVHEFAHLQWGVFDEHISHEESIAHKKVWSGTSGLKVPADKQPKATLMLDRLVYETPTE